MQNYNVIGVMSGTSLDGLDIVFCSFKYSTKWTYNIKKSLTIEYSKDWKNKLQLASSLSGLELSILNKEFGIFTANAINNFVNDLNSRIDLIASHGHTVFHQPNKKLTLQIGDGQEIATQTGITTIADFRTKDIVLGGQGAPLVPIGDKHLFSEYDFCLNLGGFANISYEQEKQRIAYDICPTNIILNYLTDKLGHAFDKNGALGLLGKVDQNLLEDLNTIDFYNKTHPKSLGKEWLEQKFIPVIDKTEIPLHDKLRTVYEHISDQIVLALNKKEKSKTLITGGGAYNKLLINLIKKKTDSSIVIPESDIIEYKEALIFALLGILRVENKINCLSSVTGATNDSSCGIIFNP